MTKKLSTYVHGSAPEEQRRLSRLNELMNASSLREMALRGGERILDLGSGLGQLTRAMARTAGPKGCAVGIEGSRDQLREAILQARAAGEEQLVDFREGDVLDAHLEEDEWGTFDLAHARFLLEHVPDPARVVKSMHQALRPGGRIVLEDDDHGILRLWPEPAGLSSLWDAYLKTYRDIGNDPFVGRRLVELMSAAGFQARRNTWLFFGACSGSPDFIDYVENLAKIFEGAREPIISHLEPSAPRQRYHAGARAFDDGLAALRAWGQRSDAAFWYAIAWAEGTKPDS